MLKLLTLLFVISFFQNMAFTWSSRSRNSGDPNYHRFAAWSSNGVWFICNLLNVKIMWEPLMNGDWLTVGLGGLVYIIVFMMRLLLGDILFARILTDFDYWLFEKFGFSFADKPFNTLKRITVVIDNFLHKWFIEQGQRKVGSDKKK